MVEMTMVMKLHRWWLRVQLQIVLIGMVAAIVVSSFVKRKRMSHENGITCRGTVRVVDDPTCPPHRFEAKRSQPSNRLNWSVSIGGSPP